MYIGTHYDKKPNFLEVGLRVTNRTDLRLTLVSLKDGQGKDLHNWVRYRDRHSFWITPDPASTWRTVEATAAIHRNIQVEYVAKPKWIQSGIKSKDNVK